MIGAGKNELLWGSWHLSAAAGLVRVSKGLDWFGPTQNTLNKDALTPGRGEHMYKPGLSLCFPMDAEDQEPRTWITLTLQMDS